MADAAPPPADGLSATGAITDTAKIRPTGRFRFAPSRTVGSPMHRPAPTLSPRALTLLWLAVCLVPLTAITAYVLIYGRTSDQPLPVTVSLDKRPVDTVGGGGAMVTDVVVINNHGDFDIPNLTMDLNGQYFLYRQSPLKAGEELVLPQEIFSTKSNQRFVPGRYPIRTVNVTGRLPSGARGVAEVHFPDEP